MENENLNVNLTGNTVASAQPQKKNVVGAVLVAVATLLGTALNMAFFYALYPILEKRLDPEYLNAVYNGISQISGAAVNILGFVILVLFALSQKSKIERLMFIFSGTLAVSAAREISSAIRGIPYLGGTLSVNKVSTIIILVRFILAPILAAVIFVLVNKLCAEIKER